jgi:hypothetical protein
MYGQATNFILFIFIIQVTLFFIKGHLAAMGGRFGVRGYLYLQAGGGDGTVTLVG